MSVDLGSAHGKIELDSSGVDKGVQQAVSSVNGLESGLAKVSGCLTALGTGMVAAGGAIAAGLGFAVKTAMDYEQALVNAVSVTGLTGEAADKAKAKMDKLATSLGLETAFSAKEAANAMYDLASAGWTAEDMAKGLRGIMDLAASTQSDLTETTEIVTSTLAQFSLATSDSSRVADVFTKVIGSTKAKIGDLGYSMKYVGPIAAALGWSLEQTTAVLGKLYDAGFKGEQAGTALRGAISQIATPSKEAAGALAELGLSVEDVNPATRSLADILDTLKTAGLDSAGAFKIFGTESAPAMLALMNMSKEGKSGTQMIRELEKELKGAGGTAGRVAKDQLNTLAGQLKILKGSFEGLLISIGKVFVPILKELATSLTPVVNAFASLPEPVKQALGVIAAGAAAFLLIGGGILLALGAVGSLVGAISALGIEMGTAIGIASGAVAVFAALAGTAYLVISNWGKISAALKPAVDAIRDAFSQIGAAVATSFGPVMAQVQEIGKKLVAFFKSEILPGLQGFADSFSSTIGPAIKSVADFLSGSVITAAAEVVSFFVDQFGVVVDWFITNWPLIQETCSTVMNAIWSVIGPVVSAIVAIFQFAWPYIQSIVSGAWEIIKTIISTAISVVLSVITLAMQLITGNWSGAWETIKNIASTLFNAIITILSTALGWLVTAIAGAVAAVINWFAQLPGRVGAFLSDLFGSKIPTLIGAGAAIMVNLVVNGITAVINWFAQLPGRIAAFLSQVVNWVKERFQSAKNTATSTTQSLISQVINFFSSLPGRIASLIASIPGKLRNVFQDARDRVVSVLVTMLDYIRGLPGKVAGIAASIGSALWNGLVGWLNKVKEGFQNALDLRKRLSPSVVDVFSSSLDTLLKEAQRLYELPELALAARYQMVPAFSFGSAGAASITKEVMVERTIERSSGGDLHLHIGTLIADDAGLKSLENTLREFRVQEDIRRGR